MSRYIQRPTVRETSDGFRTPTEVVVKNRRLLEAADAALYASMGIDPPVITQVETAATPAHPIDARPIPGFSAYTIARDGTVYGDNGPLRPKGGSVQMCGDDDRYTSRAVARLLREVWGV
jgi:hypothetical protein